MSGQRADIFGVGQRVADHDVGEARDRDDVTRAGALGRVAVESLGDHQLGDAHVVHVAVVTHPRDGLTLLQRAVEDPQQCETAEERRRVEVRDVGLERSLRVVRRRRDVLEDGFEQRLEVAVVGQGAVLGLVQAGGAVTAGGVDDRDVEDRVQIEIGHVVGEVARETEQEVLALVHDGVDARVRTVGLVDQQDDRKLGLQRLAQHEPGLRERALGGVDQQHDAVDHGQAALDLSTEVGVARGVDHVDGDRAVRSVLALVRDRRVLGEDRDALLALQLVGVHGTVFDVLVVAERVGLPQHGVHQRGLAVVDVGDDRDVAQIVAVGDGVLGHA